MSDFVDGLLNEIYSGLARDLPDEALEKLRRFNALDEYVEESVKMFLNEFHHISYLPGKRMRVVHSVIAVDHLGRSLAPLPSDSICFAVYLINLADKTDWMEEFLSSVGVNAGLGKPLFLHYKEGDGDEEIEEEED